MAKTSENEATQKLQELLSKGLAVVEYRQRYKARNRVTTVCAIDIDNDGDQEIIFGGADGRLSVLSKECEIRWSEIVGDKSPVTAVATLPHQEGTRKSVLIVVGTESGELYVYTKDGQIFDYKKQIPDIHHNDLEGHLLERCAEADTPQYLFKCAQAINQISITPDAAAHIVFTSEDRHAYALNHKSREQLWQPPFPANGWARCVFACDIDSDGQTEILVSTANNYLYLLDHTGQKQKEVRMEHPVRALFATDINHDNIIEILVATDKHDIIALTPELKPLWSSCLSANRLRALHIVDINRDRTQQIITGGDDKHLYILDAEGKLLWRHFLGTRIASLCASDIYGDGIQEIIVGTDDEWGQ